MMTSAEALTQEKCKPESSCSRLLNLMPKHLQPLAELLWRDGHAEGQLAAFRIINKFKSDDR